MSHNVDPDRRRDGRQTRDVQAWSEGMVCAGYLDHEPEEDTYRLPEEHAYRLASEGTDHFVGGLSCAAPMPLRVAPRVAQPFATGGGVPFADSGVDCVGAFDRINRGQYEQRFATH